MLLCDWWFSSNYVDIFISVYVSETMFGHCVSKASREPFDPFKNADGVQILCWTSGCNIKLFRQLFFSMIFLYTKVFCYYLLLFVFWTFKGILTFQNVFYWSNNTFLLWNNFCCDIHELLITFLSWFWQMNSHAEHVSYHKIAWKQCQTWCMNFNHHKTHNNASSNCTMALHHV